MAGSCSTAATLRKLLASGAPLQPTLRQAVHAALELAQAEQVALLTIQRQLQQVLREQRGSGKARGRALYQRPRRQGSGHASQMSCAARHGGAAAWSHLFCSRSRRTRNAPHGS
jgi:hypothetical protein